MEIFRNKPYLPLYSDNEKKFPFRTKFKKFASLTVAMPFLAFTLCVVISILKDYESVNFTHCHVTNILPSVSAAIGSYYPQNLIWKIAIAIHSCPRYIIAFIYFRYNSSIIKRKVYHLVLLTFLFNIVEITSLIGLSFWNSTVNYPFHKTCFVTFVATSELYMMLTCILRRRHMKLTPSDVEKRSLKVKWYLLFINIGSVVSAGYFFVRHNTYCEPMMYSVFAASEYMVILTNMGFHMTACFDFADKDITIKDMDVTID